MRVDLNAGMEPTSNSFEKHAQEVVSLYTRFSKSGKLHMKSGIFTPAFSEEIEAMTTKPCSLASVRSIMASVSSKFSTSDFDEVESQSNPSHLLTNFACVCCSVFGFEAVTLFSTD